MRALLPLLLAVSAAAPPAKKPVTPTDLLAAAPASAWKTIDPSDLMIMDLKGGGRVVIQLAPQFAPVHVGNVRALTRSGWWNGSSVYRVQDNYVAQWGRNEDNPKLPAGVVAKPPAEYHRSLKGLSVHPLGYPDDYAPRAGFASGWPIGYDPKASTANLVHCYGYVGVARDLSPDTGSGGELYAIIGHAPRALDRNIAVIGRVIKGIDQLSSLTRGTGDLGFYKQHSQELPITKGVLASDMPESERPSFQYLDTSSSTFARLVQLRANRKDQFFIRPAGGIDLCAATVPVRATPKS